MRTPGTGTAPNADGDPLAEGPWFLLNLQHEVYLTMRPDGYLKLAFGDESRRSQSGTKILLRVLP